MFTLMWIHVTYFNWEMLKPYKHDCSVWVGNYIVFTKLSKVCKVVTESTSFEHFMYYRVNNTFICGYCLLYTYTIITIFPIIFNRFSNKTYRTIYLRKLIMPLTKLWVGIKTCTFRPYIRPFIRTTRHRMCTTPHTPLMDFVHTHTQ